MYIDDINFDFVYSGTYDYMSYSPTCKAEFSVYGSYDEITNLRMRLQRDFRRPLSMPIKISDYLGLTTTNYSLIKIPPIKKVIFHDPATIVYWQDKTRTVVKCKDGETFDKEKGLAMCISKKLLGDEFHSEFRKYTEDKE